MSDRIISISAAPYDGYEFPAMLDSIASCGAQYVEPAFIVGYTEPFDESSFNLSKVPQYTTWLKQSGLQCFAFSSHIDLGKSESDTVFARRMDFARALGARVINTNAAKRTNAEGFFHHIQILAAHAERLDMIIGLENPGNGEDNLFNLAQDGLESPGTDRFAVRPAELRCREYRFTSARARLIPPKTPWSRCPAAGIFTSRMSRRGATAITLSRSAG